MSDASVGVVADISGIKEQTAAQDTIAVVKLTGEYDGITAEQVREIVRMQEITEVPNAPAHVEGVINLRGRIVPVVDLRKHFGLPGHEHTAETRIVIAEIETEQIDTSTIGLIVDGVDEIRSVSQDLIDDSTSVVASVSDEFLRGILKLEDRLVILLDINRAF